MRRRQLLLGARDRDGLRVAPERALALSSRGHGGARSGPLRRWFEDALRVVGPADLGESIGGRSLDG